MNKQRKAVSIIKSNQKSKENKEFKLTVLYLLAPAFVSFCSLL